MTQHDRTTPIDPSAFLNAMESHWVSTLSNTPSEPLRSAWRQIAEAFNEHIHAHEDPDASPTWTVLSPPTGSGKSQGTAVYCSLLAKLPEDKHPGALVVTRLKADADAMAETINKLSGRMTARSFHSDTTDACLSNLAGWDVLVITHRAFEIALDKLGQEGKLQQTWPYFHNFRGRQRALVVIDESLDLVEESQGSLEGIRHTLGAIPQQLREEHQYAVDALEELARILDKIARKADARNVRETVVLKKMVDQGNPPDMTALRAALVDVRFDHQNGRGDVLENARLRQLHDGRLKAVDAIFRSWVYYARARGVGHTLNTARLLVPPNTKGAVVLDATAEHDVIYELFDRACMVPPPQNVRDYSNVTIWVSRGHKVGKVAMQRSAGRAVEELMSDLAQRIPEEGSVFVCCHKAVEPKLTSYETPFSMKVGHWGAVDGSNQWRDCDTVVIFGLPYLPDTWSANVFFALQGVKTTEWMRCDKRPFGDHQDVRGALKIGRMAASVVQAINRARCRKVIDIDGNCLPVEVFMLLPNGSTADQLLARVRRSMPNVNIREATKPILVAQKKVRRGNFDNAIIAQATSMLPGKESASRIRKTLGVPEKTWKRMTKLMRDSASPLAQALLQVNVRYIQEPHGGSNRGYLVKS